MCSDLHPNAGNVCATWTPQAKPKRKVLHDDAGQPEVLLGRKKLREMKREFLATVHDSVKPKVRAMFKRLKRTRQWPTNVLALRQESEVARFKASIAPSFWATVDDLHARGKLFDTDGRLLSRLLATN